ncbi:MAG: hypothetical protein WBQ26_09630 [Gemmatimonadaceae bacterium]
MLATLGVVLGIGCSSGAPTGPHNLKADLPGVWAQSFPLPAGSSRVLSLSVQDTTVTGTGTYTAEAMQGGTLTVAGFITGPYVNFDITESPGGVYHFTGQLAGTDTLAGSLWTTSDPVPVTFARVSR